MHRQLVAFGLFLLLVLPRVGAAQSGIGPGQEVADLTAYIAAHEDDRGLGGDVAKAMQRLGRLEEEQKHVAAATALWKRARHWFDKHHFERNGGPEAHLAAEATWRLLTQPIAVAADLSVRTTPQLPPPAAIAERNAELDAFLMQLIGPRAANSPDSVRQGGLFADLDAVRSFGALGETRRAALSVAALEERAAAHLARLPLSEGLQPVEQTAQQAAVRQAIGELEGRAFSSIETAWLAGPDKKNADAMALRKQLTRLRPLKYPQLEEAATDMVNVTPEQAEASRLAGLAQKAEKVQLRVLYLQKAVKLDPQNPRYLELLQAAKAEAGQ